MTTEIDSFPSAALRGVWGAEGRDRIHLADDPGYDAARLSWSLAVDQRPMAVAEPRTVDEISSLVRAAVLSGLRIAPQTTGHQAAPLASRGLEDVVLLRTGGLDRVSVDAERGVVRVEGGAVWAPVVDAVAAHGRAVLHGSSPDVGVAGYTLGGGIGWYARKHGMAANSLVAAEVVIGDGTLVRADAETNASLFWALRGGGGSFGVVTALEFATFDIPTAYAGMMLWDLADIEPVLREWAAWAPTAPDAVTTSFRALQLPPIPEMPDFLRGRRLAAIDGAILGTDEEANELLAGLRALRPEVDTFDRMPSAALVRLHMDPEGPTPGVSRSSMLATLPDAGVDAFLAAAGPDADSTLLASELRQLGGALGRPAEGAGALSHLEAEFILFGVGVAATPEMATRAGADAAALVASCSDVAAQRPYLNFCDEPVETRTAYGEERWQQLKGIRSAVDPFGVFAACHPVPRLWEGGAPTA